ncbi:MAG: DUF2442 domain-containing protein [Peptococcaceae bacterium]|jgi:hypothetical protein|nr:DUF2442 domain-containing protein [Peptococcaceae bacterium]
MKAKANDVPTANDIQFTDNEIIFLLSNKGRLSFPLSEFPRLKQANKEQRKKWHLRNNGHSVRWEEIDEDISVPLILTGKC